MHVTTERKASQPGHDLLRNKAHCAAILEYFMGLPTDLPKEQLPSTQDLMMDGRFGIRPPNRINDLIHGKHDGARYDFERIACGHGVYRWRLHYPARPGWGAVVIAIRVHVEPFDNPSLPWRDRVVILRGQLTIIRTRAESGIPLSVESIRRAEDLAHSLQSEESAT